MKDEALRLALEALQSGDYWKGVEAVNAIKQALEQPEPEPVALGHKEKDKYEFVPTAKWFGELPDGVHHLYTSPPKREWKGLTGEERYDILSKSTNKNKAAARVEAKLKEKNT